MLQHNKVMVIFLITDLSWSFGAVFVSCELCHRAVYAHDKIANDFGNLNWYSFPFKTWKFLPIIISNVQQPIVIRCFGSISCTRETFKMVSRCCLHIDYFVEHFLNNHKICSQVVHKGFSFYMVFRQQDLYFLMKIFYEQDNKFECKM